MNPAGYRPLVRERATSAPMTIARPGRGLRDTCLPQNAYDGRSAQPSDHS